jgi:hypothetical protein
MVSPYGIEKIRISYPDGFPKLATVLWLRNSDFPAQNAGLGSCYY